MTEKYPLGINFIIPFYNDYKYIDYSINSIVKSVEKFNKEYGALLPYEITISNDGSTEIDETEKKFRELKEQYQNLITIVNLDRNRGVSAAKNFGVENTKTKLKYLFFLDADDMIHVDYVKLAWPFITQDYDLIYSDDLVVPDYTSKSNTIVVRSDFRDETFLSDIYNNANFSACFIIKRVIFEEIGGFDEIRELPNGEKLYLNEDVDFMLTLYGYYQDQLKYTKINRPLYIRVHAKSGGERLVTKCFSYPSSLYNKIYRYKKHHHIWSKIVEKKGFKFVKPPLYDKYENLFETKNVYTKSIAVQITNSEITNIKSEKSQMSEKLNTTTNKVIDIEYEFGINFIVPTYNDFEYLDRSVKSIYNSIKYLEDNEKTNLFNRSLCTIVDDGSQEKDRLKKCFDELISKFDEKMNIELISLTENQGVAVARNTGVEKSRVKYKYLLFLDVDDELDECCIHNCWKYLLDDYDLIYFPCWFVDKDLLRNSNNKKNAIFRTYDFTELSPSNFYELIFFPCIILKRTTFNIVGGYDTTKELKNGEKLHISEDVDLMLTIYGMLHDQGLKYIYLKNKPGYYYMHDKKYELKRNKKIKSFPNSLIYRCYIYKKHHKNWDKIFLKLYNKTLPPPPYYKTYSDLLPDI